MNNTTYWHIENRQKSAHERRCIDGRITGCGLCVGYCNYEKHRGYLTEYLRVKHKCIEKMCSHYIPKEKRTYETAPESDYPRKAQTVNFIIEQTRPIECVRVIRVQSGKDNSYDVFYVSISDDRAIETEIARIEKRCGTKIRLHKLDYDFDICVNLILNKDSET